MPDLLLDNALLVNLHPARVEPGAVLIREGRLRAVGRSRDVTAIAMDSTDPAVGSLETLDLGGDLLMPGLVNGHTHLYSALACGMPPPRRAPRSFQEILIEVWWWMDRALDLDMVDACGRAGALDALRCGTTALIDHHASPAAIAGSLERLSAAVAEIGPRGVYAYEVTDRRGAAGAHAGIEENARFARTIAREVTERRPGGSLRGALFGLHAAFTCRSETLKECRKRCDEIGLPVHIHVAEDHADRDLTRQHAGADLVDYLIEQVGVGEGALLAHCTHLAEDEILRLAEADCCFAHQSRSNMNNQVGHANLGAIPRDQLLLGTDGIGSDMFAEAQAAYFKSRDGRSGLTPGDTLRALANNARFAGDRLGEPQLGQLLPGAPADLVRLDYNPATPLSPGNLAWHFIFQLGSRFVSDVWVAGRRVVADRRPQALQEGHADPAELRRQAERLFEAMRDLEGG